MTLQELVELRKETREHAKLVELFDSAIERVIGIEVEGMQRREEHQRKREEHQRKREEHQRKQEQHQRRKEEQELKEQKHKHMMHLIIFFLLVVPFAIATLVTITLVILGAIGALTLHDPFIGMLWTALVVEAAGLSFGLVRTWLARS